MPVSEDPPDRVPGPARENRRHLRRRVLWAARIVTTIGERPCTVLNLSKGGALIRLDATLDRCSNVQLAIPGIGRLDGFVVWSNHDRAGVQFSDLPEALGAELDRALSGQRRGS